MDADPYSYCVNNFKDSGQVRRASAQRTSWTL